MDDVVVGIPTLDRPRLLRMCVDSILAGSVLPRAICIIDNGNYVDPAQLPCSPGVELQVIKTPYNIGVAASWNLIHRLHRPLDLVISNDDVIFDSDTLATFRAVAKDQYLVFLKIPRSYGGYRCFQPEDRDLEWYAGGYSCFMIREPMFERVGPFDELLWPGYWEDTDFSKRCGAAGMGPHVACVEGSFKHGVSHADVRLVADPISRPFVDPLAEWNRRRLILKWGWNDQPPYINRYEAPFDGKPIDELELFFQHALIELKIYPPCHVLAPHLPAVRGFASACRTIVEFGRGLGIVTCALLAGHPESLISYDSSPRMEPYKLMGLRGRTQLEFRDVATASASIAPMEMLAVVDNGDRAQFRAALGYHSFATRHLVALGGPGAGAEIELFQAAQRQWRSIHQGVSGETTLWVFQRQDSGSQ